MLFLRAFRSFSVVVAVLGAALPLAVRAAPQPAPVAPFSFETAPGRLPKDVIPTDYTIVIAPDQTSRTLTGRESIGLTVRKPTIKIVLNSLGERFTATRFDGVPVAGVESRDDRQFTTITLTHRAKAGRHTLAFAYTAKIQTEPRGLFVQPYTKPGGGNGVMLSTQFEATDARRMFPCWDEPAFRATYALTVTVPATWSTVSNMPIAGRVEHGPLATTTFARTPKMPSYLVEFSAGDLASIDGRSGATKVGVWAVRGQEQDGRTALANARQILADYNDYFGYAFPLPKLDSIAVPGGFSGAMENWGAITYNDQLLLATPSSTIGQRQEIFSVQAHEMAHQWNGDLVTMGWWDDIWLNESFASWRAAKETDLRNPSWNWWEGQDDDKEGAMSADSRTTSHAIAQHVTDELKALSAFDSEITYSKGQAVLRMLEAYLGPDTFRDGIRRYMRARAFSNATSADLWNALGAASGKDVSGVASSWIVQPGFPLVSVAATCDAAGRRTITLEQKRFLLNGSDPTAERWSVPLNVRSGANGTPVPVLFKTDGQTLAAGNCTDALSVNAGGGGYYRVAYDAATLAINRKAFGSLPDADKIVLLDDGWALVQSGAEKLPAYLGFAESMGTDLDARAWQQITGSLATIEYAERGTSGYPAFTAYARALIAPLVQRLGWDATSHDAPDVVQLRATALTDLGAWGDAKTLAEARKRFSGFMANRNTVQPDEQGTLLAIIAINADQATFDQLHAIAKSARNETEVRRYYSALMQVRDPNLARQALAIALSPEIPPQAGSLRFRLVAQVAEYQPQIAWQTFKQNIKPLMAPMSAFAPITLAQEVPATYWDAAPPGEIERWVGAHVASELAPELSRGIERAQFSVAQKAALVPATDTYVGSQRLRSGSDR